MQIPTLRDFVKAVQKKTYYPITEAKARAWAEGGILKCWRDPLKKNKEKGNAGWWYPIPDHLEEFMMTEMELGTHYTTEVLKELGLNFRQLMSQVSDDRTKNLSESSKAG